MLGACTPTTSMQKTYVLNAFLNVVTLHAFSAKSKLPVRGGRKISPLFKNTEEIHVLIMFHQKWNLIMLVQP